MLWDGLIVVFVVLTLGAAFGAMPLSVVLRRYRLLRLSAAPSAPAVVPASREADVIPFPAARPIDTAEQDEAAMQARRA